MTGIFYTLGAGVFSVLVFWALYSITGFLSFGLPLLEVLLRAAICLGFLVKVVSVRDLDRFWQHLKTHGLFLSFYAVGTRALWGLVFSVLQKWDWWYSQYSGHADHLVQIPLLPFQALVLAPISEELIFRHLFVNTAEKSASANPAVILIGGLAFALAHHPSLWFFALAHGLFLTWYYLRHRDLLMVILLHAGINLMNYLRLKGWLMSG